MKTCDSAPIFPYQQPDKIRKSKSYLLNRAQSTFQHVFFFSLSLQFDNSQHKSRGKRGTKSNERRIEILHSVFRVW